MRLQCGLVSSILTVGIAVIPGACAQTSGSANRQQALQRERRPYAQRQPDLECDGEQVDSPSGRFGKKQLWNGYQISMEAKTGDSDNDCSATIYDRSGHSVYSTTGPDVVLDPSTGMDIDGDGSADVVILNGANGNGGGGDFQLDAISFQPKPRVLFTTAGQFQMPAFRRDSQGRAVLWSAERIGADLQTQYDMPNGDTPGFARAWRFTGGRLVEVTPEYWTEIRKGMSFPSEQEIHHFRTSNIAADQFEDREAADMLGVIVQEIYCRRFDSALAFIRRVWPRQDQENLIRTLRAESKSWDCSQCAKGIAAWQ